MDIALSSDTHYYDGRLIELGWNLREYFESIYDPSKSLHYFEICRKQLTDPQALQVLQVLENDDIAVQGSPIGPNFDSSNNLTVGQLIGYCAIIAEHQQEIKEVLETQCLEMLGGFCPQGRTTRLIQVLMVYIDWSVPKFVIPEKKDEQEGDLSNSNVITHQPETTSIQNDPIGIESGKNQTDL